MKPTTPKRKAVTYVSQLTSTAQALLALRLGEFYKKQGFKEKEYAWFVGLALDSKIADFYYTETEEVLVGVLRECGY